MGNPGQHERITLRGPAALERFERFWTTHLPKAKRTSPLHRDARPSTARWVANVRTGLMFSYVVVNDDDAPNVELYINWPDRERNLRVFTELETKKQDIERGYGASLSWLPREGEGVACRIAADVPGHSFQKEPGWPQLQDAMIAAMGRLESALAPHLEKYREPDQL